jgi:presenilin-like A22 family membrane protease
LPVANPNLTVTVLPAVPLLISTAIPAVITVYKVEHYSLKYNPDASTVLLLNR